MKTEEQILTRAQTLQESEYNDIFGWRVGLLAEFLSVDNLLKLKLKEGTTRESLLEATGDKPFSVPITREAVLNAMRDYMSFAWEKANNERGISSSRSIDKMREWMWILDEEDAVDWDDYNPFGRPILRAICEKYGFPVPEGVSYTPV